MVKGKLTREQNVKAATVFLNNFNLKLEEKDDLNKHSRLKIIDYAGDPVGELYFDKEYIKIRTLSPFGILNAQYKMSYYNVDFDIINGGVNYCSWGNYISYDIYKHRDEKYSGSFIIEGSIDENGKKYVAAQSSLKLMLDDEDVMAITLASFDNDNFVMSILDDCGYDEITYRPNRLSHIRTTEDGEDSSFLVHEKDDSIIIENDIFQNDNLIFNGDLDKELAIGNNKTQQMINMMNKHNPSLKRRVGDASRIFTSNNCNLLTNAVNTCFATAQNEDVLELLGLSDKKITYQNGSNNLRDAYFGKDSEEFNLSPKMHRKLKKKI